MKIYNKSAFAFGIFCAGGLVFFALGIIPADWWQWLLMIAISGRYLYIGLSETASENENTIQQHYRETAIRLYGKYALIKTNLPIILLVIFFGVALFIRFVFDIVTPVGIAVVFCILLTISAAYSIGLNQTIQDTIKNEIDGLQQHEND